MRFRLLAAGNGSFTLSFFLACFLALFLAACDDSGKAPEKTKQLVGLFLFNGKDPFVNVVSEALIKRLAHSVELDVQDAGNDPIRQPNQVDAFLTRHPALLLVNPVDPKNAGFFVARAKRAGIPIIFFNREPDMEVLRSYSKSCYVGTNPADAGRMQGNQIAQIWRQHREYDQIGRASCRERV